MIGRRSLVVAAIAALALVAAAAPVAPAQPGAPLPAVPCFPDSIVRAGTDTGASSTYATRGSYGLPDGSRLYTIGLRKTADSVLYVEHWLPTHDTTAAPFVAVCVGRLVASKDRATWTYYRRGRTPARGSLTWVRVASVGWLALATETAKYVAAFAAASVPTPAVH